MNVIGIVQIFATAVGIASAAIVLFWRRFGPPSWLLSGFLFFSALSPGLLATASPGPDARIHVILAFAALVLAAPCGLLFSWSVKRPDYTAVLAQRRRLIALVLISVPLLLAALAILRPPVDLVDGLLALGLGGYLSSLYLLVVAVMALAALEQMVRGVEEIIRWQVKFLVLGLAGCYASLVFVSSEVLIYKLSYEDKSYYGLLPPHSLDVFSVLYPLCCALILYSWRRSSERSVIRVSQSLVFSSITLLAVGVYLISTGVIWKWLEEYVPPDIPIEAIVLLLALLLLAAILLTTQFRHRARLWIRRNVFAGKYDYRRYWMEATEQVRWEDDAKKTADALIQIVQSAIGAIDVGVWLRRWNPNGLTLLSRSGAGIDSPAAATDGIVETLVDQPGPFSAAELPGSDAAARLRQFMERTRASILVPLVSSNRIVGLLSVGSDRSGQPFDRETREFLGVLGNHAASEFHKHELLATLVETREMEAFRTFSTFLLHDLKNFASTLSLIARNAERHRGNPDFERDAFQSVFDTAEKMKRLCNTLRTFSSGLAANKKPGDLNGIVRAVAGALDAGDPAQIRLELGDLPPVLLDAEEMTRVLQNLVLNARQAISSGGSIRIRTACVDGAVELSVSDDGHGMSREFLAKELFVPFHTTKSDGLGIGLFQTKKIVEAHDGRIQVESEEGKGTTVTVRLPAKQRVLAAENAKSGVRSQNEMQNNP